MFKLNVGITKATAIKQSAIYAKYEDAIESAKDTLEEQLLSFGLPQKMVFALRHRFNFYIENMEERGMVKFSDARKERKIKRILNDGLEIIRAVESRMESELDAILIHQECSDLITSIAMGSSSYRPDSETHRQLKRSKLILQSFDTGNGEPGAKEACWWKNAYKQCRRWP